MSYLSPTDDNDDDEDEEDDRCARGTSYVDDEASCPPVTGCTTAGGRHQMRT